MVVGLPPRIARVLTPPLVAAFRQTYPEAAITVAEGLSAQMREWLLSGRVDLALLYDPPATPQLATELLLREKRVLAAARQRQPALPELLATRLAEATAKLMRSIDRQAPLPAAGLAQAALSSSRSQRGRTVKAWSPSVRSTRPALTRSAAAKAIMAPLSVQSSSGGK